MTHKVCHPDLPACVGWMGGWRDGSVFSTESPYESEKAAMYSPPEPQLKAARSATAEEEDVPPSDLDASTLVGDASKSKEESMLKRRRTLAQLQATFLETCIVSKHRLSNRRASVCFIEALALHS